MKPRTAGSLTHADFGQVVTVPGYGPGVLWAVQHVAAVGDIPEPWTRLTLRRTWGGGCEATRGLPPDTPVTLSPAGGWPVKAKQHAGCGKAVRYRAAAAIEAGGGE